METHFQIIHKVVDGKHTLSFNPKHEKGNNYKPKVIEVSEEQWDSLRYHFATGIDDITGETILAYVI